MLFTAQDMFCFQGVKVFPVLDPHKHDLSNINSCYFIYGGPASPTFTLITVIAHIPECLLDQMGISSTSSGAKQGIR